MWWNRTCVFVSVYLTLTPCIRALTHFLYAHFFFISRSQINSNKWKIFDVLRLLSLTKSITCIIPHAMQSYLINRKSQSQCRRPQNVVFLRSHCHRVVMVISMRCRHMWKTERVCGTGRCLPFGRSNYADAKELNLRWFTISASLHNNNNRSHCRRRANQLLMHNYSASIAQRNTTTVHEPTDTTLSSHYTVVMAAGWA